MTEGSAPRRGNNPAALALAVMLTVLISLCSSYAAKADRLWLGGPDLWGKIIAVDNNYVTFQIDCTGEHKRHRWRTNGFAISFTEGCKKVPLAAWGEPVDCRRTGRLFVVGAQGSQDFVDFISFENDVLIVGYKGRKLRIKEPRTEKWEIWMGCS